MRLGISLLGGLAQGGYIRGLYGLGFCFASCRCYGLNAQEGKAGQTGGPQGEMICSFHEMSLMEGGERFGLALSQGKGLSRENSGAPKGLVRCLVVDEFSSCSSVLCEMSYSCIIDFHYARMFFE